MNDKIGNLSMPSKMACMMCNPPGELTQVDPHMQYKQLHKEMKIYNRKEK